MPRPNHALQVLLPASPLLITESADEFNRILDALRREINPSGIIDEIYLLDYADLTWEVIRLRRCKVAIVNSAFLSALKDLFKKLLQQIGYDYLKAEEIASDTARRWFTNKGVKKWGDNLLRQFQLDASAIEAEAHIRFAKHIEYLDRLLTSAESRRNKALRSLAEHRATLARQLKAASDRIIEGEVVALEDSPITKAEASSSDQPISSGS
jgi:hypothetical protein